MSFSYSRVECHDQCPYKYFLRYIEKIEPEPNQEPNNPLYLGTAIHEGIEKRSIEAAINSYKSNYPELTEANEFEIEKLKAILPKAIEEIPEGEYEFRISDPDGFVGFIDMLVSVGDRVYDLYDFKHSNNVDRYKKSSQVHVYKYYYEKMTGNKIRNIYYIIIPKCLDEGLDRYKAEAKIQFEPIQFDKTKVGNFFAHKLMMEKDDKFIKRKTKLCEWCEYRAICEEQ